MKRTITRSTIIIALLAAIASFASGAHENAQLLENEAVVETLVQGFFTQQDVTVADTVLSETFIAHDPVNGEMDREAFIEFYSSVEVTMPEYSLMSGRDLVALQILDVVDPPVMLDLDRFDIGSNGIMDTLWNFFRLADGQIAEAWLIYDELSLLHFIGTPTRSPAEPGGQGSFQPSR